MAINFSELPQKNPFSTPAPGFYKFVVTSAVMKPPKDPTKPMYLNMTLALTTFSGQRIGNLRDNLFDSAAPAVLYKLSRFVRALKLQLEGNVELRDLAKLVPNRGGIVEIENVQDSRFPNDPTRLQAQVRMFGSECYWTIEEMNQLVENQPQAAAPAQDIAVPWDFDQADGVVPPPAPAPGSASDY